MILRGLRTTLLMRHVRLLVPALLLAALAVYTLRARPAQRQADVRHCTETSLAVAGLGAVAVEVTGGELRLSGSVSDPVDRDRARRAALQCGAGTVVNEVAMAPQGPYTTRVCVQLGRLEIVGTVPDRAQRAALLTATTEGLGDVTVSTRLVLRPGAPEGYERVLRSVPGEVSQLDRGCLEIVGRSLAIRGLVRSAAVGESIRARLEAAAGPGYEVQVEVDLPRLSPDALHCQEAFDALLSPGAHVLFEPGASELHEDGRKILDTVREIRSGCRTARILVVGHTDDSGDAAYNRELSLRRAQAVVDYLVLRGMGPEDLQARGLGEAQPRASNGTQDGRLANRRIELRVLDDRG